MDYIKFMLLSALTLSVGACASPIPEVENDDEEIEVVEPIEEVEEVELAGCESRSQGLDKETSVLLGSCLSSSAIADGETMAQQPLMLLARWEIVEPNGFNTVYLWEVSDVSTPDDPPVAVLVNPRLFGNDFYSWVWPVNLDENATYKIGIGRSDSLGQAEGWLYMEQDLPDAVELAEKEYLCPGYFNSYNLRVRVSDPMAAKGVGPACSW